MIFVQQGGFGGTTFPLDPRNTSSNDAFIRTGLSLFASVATNFPETSLPCAQMSACIVLQIMKTEDLWKTCAVTGRNLFHKLALHSHHGNSGFAMAMLMANFKSFDVTMIRTTDNQGDTPLGLALKHNNNEFARALMKGYSALL